MNSSQIDLTPLNQKGLLGVYGLWYQPWWHNGWIFVIAIALLLVVAAYFFLCRYRRVSKLTADQEALQELYRLQSGTHASQSSLHEAYFRLTMIMKNYLASTYGVVLHDKTDVQIVSMLHGIVSQNMLSLLQEFFDRSFRIKFAYDAVCETMLVSDIEMLQKLVIEMSKQQQVTGK